VLVAVGCTGEPVEEGIPMPHDVDRGHTNALINETSPYLLQHAYNPVNWYPWSEKAFEKARRENKPIFLSIGYSACHWCHVMERESFENEQIAEALNRDFISIKVDREERPDVDEIYMGAVQMMTGSGGWPLSVFITPELNPFFGGTYFPPDDRYGRPGFKRILERVASVWRDRQAEVVADSEAMASALRASASPPVVEIPPDKLQASAGKSVEQAISSLLTKGYQVLGKQRFSDAAEGAASFIRSGMIRAGEVLHTHRDGKVGVPGFLDDYANAATAMVDLYETSFAVEWLTLAEQLVRKMIELFWDCENHGFYSTSARHRHLLRRTKSYSDGSTPSGNAVAALLLARLGKLTDNADYAEKALQIIASAMPEIERNPYGSARMLQAADFSLQPGIEIAIVGETGSDESTAMLASVWSRFLPEAIIAFAAPDAIEAGGLRDRIPLLADRPIVSGSATAYVCRDFVCRKPVTTAADLCAVLDEFRRNRGSDGNENRTSQ